MENEIQADVVFFKTYLCHLCTR